ncbi:kinase-like domain-containing protein [Phakopsora pachyrhizi]|uniref:Kinase-like domain-containing protein n=1 Tax=Phakopsora pachyrhizi TaxID=170000 RepID=A0AAV0API8_PHAPC|nr:kinase-like domain-containing protein [Phakopsora pachyrhizi]
MSAILHRNLSTQDQNLSPKTMNMQPYQSTRSYLRPIPKTTSAKGSWKLDTFLDHQSGLSKEIVILADTPSPQPQAGPSKSIGTQRAHHNDKEDRDRKRRELEKLPIDDKEGHYIVRPDDLLGDHRYQVVRLLGQGTFGKVVQAVDLHSPIDRYGRRKEVAVKVIRAVQKYRDASKIEIKVLNLLRDRDPDNINKCIHLLDVFDYRNHICIVTELLALSVFDFLKENHYNPFPASHIQSFAKQLLSSVAFLHELRLVHTDLKPENILLVDSSATVAPLKRGSKQSKKILRCSEIRLIDFGSATFEDEYHASVVSTRHYRAPEIILNMPWSYPCDVWSVGCILVEFFTGEALFQTHDNLEHLAMMEVVFGPMPEPFARKVSRNRPDWFGKNYRLDYPQSNTSRQSRKFVRAMRRLDEIIPQTSIVNARFKDLLSKLLEWEPHKRISVRDALKHSYFTLKIDDEGTLY